MLFEEEYRAECWTFLGFGDPRLDGVQDYKPLGYLTGLVEVLLELGGEWNLLFTV